MILILKAKRFASSGALKTLDFALTRCPLAAERFVDVLGLKTLFAIFMGRTKISGARSREMFGQASSCIFKAKSSSISSLMGRCCMMLVGTKGRDVDERELEERSVSAISNLFQV